MKLHQPESEMKLSKAAETARIGTSAKNKPRDNPAPYKQSAAASSSWHSRSRRKNTCSIRAQTAMTIVDAGLQRPALTLQRR